MQKHPRRGFPEEVQVKKRTPLLFLSSIALIIAFALPASAAPEKLKFNNPMNAPKVAAVDTAKAGLVDKKAKKAKKAAAKAKPTAVDAKVKAFLAADAKPAKAKKGKAKAKPKAKVENKKA